MSSRRTLKLSPRMREAITELKALIWAHLPAASFEVTDDPEDREGVLLMPMVDIEDRGPVMDVIIDRLVEMQAEEQLPIVVMIVRPEARNEAILRSMGNSAP